MKKYGRSKQKGGGHMNKYIVHIGVVWVILCTAIGVSLYDTSKNLSVSAPTPQQKIAPVTPSQAPAKKSKSVKSDQTTVQVKVPEPELTNVTVTVKK